MTAEDLKTMQAWSFERKVSVTQTRILEWKIHAEERGKKPVIGFSGGKDSTVLLDIARKVDPEMKALFCDTGTEFPEIVEFVKAHENVDNIRPFLCGEGKCVNCRDGCYGKAVREFGWLFPSKDVAERIDGARKGAKWAIRQLTGLNPDMTESVFGQRYKKWAALIDCKFKISSKCCAILKERPLNKYAKKHGYLHIIATMASESQRRRTAWLKTGCNAFDIKRPVSKPMSFWTNQDVLEYLRRYKLPYASVYGDIAEVKGKLKMTGQQRTGCVLCPAGCHLQNPSKYSLIRRTHPEMWKLAERLGLPELLDFVGVDYSIKPEQLKFTRYL